MAQRGVEVGERLVEQEDTRIAHDGAADRHALPLPARKRLRLALEIFVELEDFGRLAHPLIDLGLGHSGDAQPESHVLVDSHVRVERIGLEHHGDAAL